MEYAKGDASITKQTVLSYRLETGLRDNGVCHQCSAIVIRMAFLVLF